MKKKGFTLIELIVVIAVLMVLVGLIMFAVTGYIEKSQEQTCSSNRDLINRSILIVESEGVQVSSLEQLKAKDKSMYKGGEICPKKGFITIHKLKAYCTIHTGLLIGVDSFDINHGTTGLTDDYFLANIGKIDTGDIFFWNNEYYAGTTRPNRKDLVNITVEEYLSKYTVKVNFDRYYEDSDGAPRAGDVKKFSETEFYVYYPQTGVPEAYSWIAIQPRPIK